MKNISVRLLALFLFLGLTSPLFADEVKLVYSQDIASYQEVIAGFKTIYKEPFYYDLKGSPAEFNKIKKPLLEGDLIVTIGLLATVSVRDEIRERPSKGLIFSMLFDPARFSLPNERSTGVSLVLSPKKTFSKIKQIFPNSKRIGILYDPQKSQKMIEAAEQAAKEVGLSFMAVPVLSEKWVPRAVGNLFGQIDLFWLIPDSTVITPQSIEFILLSSFEHRLPVVTFSEDIVKMGAVASIAPDYKMIGEAVGLYDRGRSGYRRWGSDSRAEQYL